jgi:hypothetical protein
MLLSVLASTAVASVVQGAELLRDAIPASMPGMAIAPTQVDSAVEVNDTTLVTPSQLAQAGATLADGVYLYGQSPMAEQLGSAYLVFQVSSDDVVGAFYMPHSSFDCFVGEFQGNQLALQITDSYEQVTFPYSIALETDAVVASSGEVVSGEFGLAGFHPIESISENDYRILDVCKVDMGQ